MECSNRTKDKENVTQDDRKAENETQECDFKIAGMMRNMSKLRKAPELKKLQNQKITMRKKLKRMKRYLCLNCSQKIMKKKLK